MRRRASSDSENGSSQRKFKVYIVPLIPLILGYSNIISITWPILIASLPFAELHPYGWYVFGIFCLYAELVIAVLIRYDIWIKDRKPPIKRVFICSFSVFSWIWSYLAFQTLISLYRSTSFDFAFIGQQILAVLSVLGIIVFYINSAYFITYEIVSSLWKGGNPILKIDRERISNSKRVSNGFLFSSNYSCILYSGHFCNLRYISL